jgi:hypothetical protein
VEPSNSGRCRWVVAIRRYVITFSGLTVLPPTEKKMHKRLKILKILKKKQRDFPNLEQEKNALK